jgi:hypothetical protein
MAQSSAGSAEPAGPYARVPWQYVGYKPVHRNYLKDNSGETGSRDRSYSEIIWKKGEKNDSEALKGETWRQQGVVFL